MTRKHFRVIAEAMSDVLNEAKAQGEADVVHGVEIAIRSIADACSDCNSRFNYPTFYRACGM